MALEVAPLSPIASQNTSRRTEAGVRDESADAGGGAAGRFGRGDGGVAGDWRGANFAKDDCCVFGRAPVARYAAADFVSDPFTAGFGFRAWWASALALAGLLFQGLFRNPIADPYVTGSSGGAIFGACIGIFFFSQWSVLGFSATALLAFAGSALTMAVVYSLARAGGRTNVVTLLLAGFAISTMFTNTTYFFELFDRTGASNRILLSWLHGVIGIPAWTELAVSASLDRVSQPWRRCP